MSDLQDQLAELRRRVARIDRKFAKPAPPRPAVPPREKPEQYFVDEWLSGDEVATPHGKHFETERLYERHRRHGSLDIGSLAELPEDLLAAISDGEVQRVAPARWAFLDTETTGLAGGSGTYAFLIGVGRITAEGFCVRQFFMRQFGEEASLLHSLSEHLAQFDVLVTYNGRTYDQPLLETRYRMNRARPPFSNLAHLDLLFGARRLWKLRFESCRLIELEQQILGVERQGDVPGEMIPYLYFDYVRKGEIFRLMPVFHHNAIDILTLACLTGIVPWAFHSVETARHHLRGAHGAELVGLARWHRQAEQYETALEYFREGVQRGVGDDLLFRTIWDIACLEKKLGRSEAALAAFSELTGSRNPFRAAAYAELAKHYEHRERNYAMALEMTRSAMEIDNSDQFRHRAARLERRLASPRNGRLL